MSGKVKDAKVLLSGDIVGFQVDSMGFLATPSAFEPIPEKEEAVSHVRICTAANILEADANRCMFRIESDIGQKSEILFGSFVKLTHFPSDFILVASNTVDKGYKGDSELKCVYLRSSLDGEEELAHKWIISPRYKLREEGDPVRTNDFIILRNAQYKHLCLTSFPLSLETVHLLSTTRDRTADFEHMVGLDHTTAVVTRPGLQIMSLKTTTGTVEQEQEEQSGASDRSLICSSDCIRIFHREYQGHLICRVDDDREIRSAATPLGSVCRKQTAVKDSSHGVFVRPLAAQKPKIPQDFPSAYSCLGVWQILLTAPTNHNTIHGNIKYGMSIRLRHVLTGQYLSVRPLSPADSDVMKQHTYALHSSELVHKNKRKRKQMAEKAIPNPLLDRSKSGPESRSVSPLIMSPQITPKNGVTSSPVKLEPANVSFRLTVKNIVGKGLKNSDWVTSPSVYLLLSFGTPSNENDNTAMKMHFGSSKLSGRHWQAKTKVIHITPGHNGPNGDVIQWDYSTDAYHQTSAVHGVTASASAHEAERMRFIATTNELSSQALRVTAMDKKNIFRDAVIGAGDGAFTFGRGSVVSRSSKFPPRKDRVDSIDTNVGELVEVHVELLDKNKLPAGTILIVLLKEMVSDAEIVAVEAEEQKELAIETALAAEKEAQNKKQKASMFHFNAVPIPLNIGAHFRVKHSLDVYDENASSLAAEAAMAAATAAAIDATRLPPVMWTVGTSTEPDENTIFTLHAMDGATDSANEQFHFMSYNERIVIEHVKTSFRLKLMSNDHVVKPTSPRQNKRTMPADHKSWWQYSTDAPFIPAMLDDELVLDAEVCQLEKVSHAEIQDILYCRRFVPLARAATAALQLTPRSSQLYLPMFRHFCVSLQSLVLWTMNATSSDASLCDVYSSGALDISTKPGTLSLQQLASQLDAEEGQLEGEEEDGSIEGTVDEQRSFFDAALPLRITNPKEDRKHQRSMTLESGEHLFENGGVRRKSSVYAPVETNSDTASVTQENVISSVKSKRSHVPALTPWLGRVLPPQTVESQSQSTKGTALDMYSTTKLRSIVEQEMRTNENISRRQGILSDTRMAEQLLHFLQVFFILQRAISLHGEVDENKPVSTSPHSPRQNGNLSPFHVVSHSLVDSYSEVPLIVRQCCFHIQDTLHACVYQNESVALKIIAIQGTFMSMISQKILGWNPPIETILKLVCKDLTPTNTEVASKSESSGDVDILAKKHILKPHAQTPTPPTEAQQSTSQTMPTSENDGLTSPREDGEGGLSAGDSNTYLPHIATSSDTVEHATVVLPERVIGLATAPSAEIDIEGVFMRAITGNDIRQIVEQMHDLHLSGETASALNILQLLTLLCSAGKAKKYFQDLLIAAVAKPLSAQVDRETTTMGLRSTDDEEDDTQGNLANDPGSGLQTDCMLFFTRYFNNQWQVKFKSRFSFPSPDETDRSQHAMRLKQEALSLKLLFTQYDTDVGTNEYLDVNECFSLLEDLGLGGPYLYEEIRHLEGSNLYSYLRWWCLRCSFYYPSGSISHCQLSPVQALELMCCPLSAEMLHASNMQEPHDIRVIFKQLNFVNIINARIPGFVMTHQTDLATSFSAPLSIGKKMFSTSSSRKQSISFSRAVTLGSKMHSIAAFSSSPIDDLYAFSVRKSSKKKSAKSENCWISVSQALHSNFHDSDWFRRSLILLNEICKDCNVYAQQVINTILPAECLLDMLNDAQVRSVDKHIACDLLCSVYVNHDFVFPTAFTPVYNNSIFCGHNENNVSRNIRVGKVFSSLSRVRQDIDGGSGVSNAGGSGRALRIVLYNYIVDAVNGLQLYSTSKVDMLYINSTLSLLRLLLCKGFFSDSEFDFYGENDLISTSSNSFRRRANDVKFDIHTLQEMLFGKLKDTLDVYRVYSEAVHSELSGVVKSPTGDLKHSASRGSISDSFGSGSFSAKIKQMSANMELLASHMPSAANRIKNNSKRKNMSHIGDTKAQFDGIFSDSKYATIIDNVMSILVTLHDTKQMLRVQSIWNAVCDTSDNLSLQAHDSSGVQITNVSVDMKVVDRNLQSIFEEPISASKQCEAIFSCTLLNEVSLQKKCYNLLNRQLSLTRDAYSIFNNTNCLRSSEQALSYRLIAVYSDVLLKLTAEVLKQPIPTRLILLERIRYTVDSIQELCINSSVVYTKHESRLSRKGKKFVFSPTAVNNSIPSYLSRPSLGGVRAPTTDGGTKLRFDRVQGIRSYLTSTLPCPIGEDDFYDLDVHKVLNSEEQMLALQMYYNDHNQFICGSDYALNYQTASIECERSLSTTCSALVDQVLGRASVTVLSYTSIVTVEHRPWSELCEAEMYVFDTSFEFLANVGSHSLNLCTAWFPRLSALCLKLIPYSKGAFHLINTMLSVLRSETSSTTENISSSENHTLADSVQLSMAQKVFSRRNDRYTVFMRDLLKKLTSMVGKGRAHKSASLFNISLSQLSTFLTAAIRSEVRELIELASTFLFDHDDLFLRSFNFRRTQPMNLIGRIELRHDLYVALSPFAELCYLEVEMPDQDTGILKSVVTPEVCTRFLSSEHTPMILKLRLLWIASRLYRRNEVHLEEMLTHDLRRMRMYYSVNPVSTNVVGGSGDETYRPPPPCHLYNCSFLTTGVLPLLLSNVQACDHATEERVNSLIRSKIDKIQTAGGLVGTSTKRFTPALNKVYVDYKSRYPIERFEEDEAESRFERVSKDSEKNAPSSVFSGTNVMSSRRFSPNSLSCLMLMLNIFALNNGAILQDLTPYQSNDLIRLVAGVVVMLQSKEFSDDLSSDSTTEKSQSNILKRLREYLSALLAQQLSVLTDEFTTSYFSNVLLTHTRKQLQKIRVVISPAKRMENMITGKSSSDERQKFIHAMELESVYSLDYIHGTALFQFVKSNLNTASRFIDLNGPLMISDENSPQVKSKAYTMRFNDYTNFDIYMQGGGKYIINLMLYLGQVTRPTQTEYTLIHILCALLDNNIDEIRSSTLIGLNLKLSLIEIETNRLVKIQNALNSLGALQFVIKTLGRSYTQHTSTFTWVYAPLAMKLGNEIVSWRNKPLQEFMITTIENSIQTAKPPEFNSLLGLQYIIRKCTADISKATATREQTRIIKTIMCVFSFVGSLCLGDSDRTQKFFTATDVASKRIVDIVQELCLLTNAVLTRLCSLITYIKYDQFYEKLAPLIWAPKDTSKRRFLAWHNPSCRNMLLITQYLHCLSVMFENLITMCSLHSNQSFLQALPKCPQLLEFLGLMQLKTNGKITTAQLSERRIFWDGGNPFSFYRQYVAELHALGFMDADPEYNNIRQTLSEWRGDNHRTVFGFNINAKALIDPSKQLVKNSKAGKTLKHDFQALFGISHPLFTRFVRETEYKCLRLLLSYLEFGTNYQARTLLSHFNDGILIQNMDNIFKGINWSFGETKDVHSSTTVAYISLIESIGTHFPETDDLLTEWDRECLSNGYHPKGIYGSVEIIGSDGRLQRLYYPVPAFVKTYWDYPEVQRAKDLIVQEVNRNSPEEKIGDFLGQMSRISVVMKRQERLRRWLTPPLHAVFGGKTTAYSIYFPKQRVLALFLCMCLNLYHVYFSSLGNPYHPVTSYAHYYFDWQPEEYFMFIIQWIVFSLNASSAIRALLNSSAADQLPDIFETDHIPLQIVVFVLQVLLGSVYLVFDALWPMALTAMSYGAIVYSHWLYVPCLIDVMFQLKDMFFLYQAIARNVGRMGFTLLLAFLILYFFSVLVFLFLGDQYNLNGHEACGSNLVACFKLHLDYGLANAPDWNNPSYTKPELPMNFIYSNLVSNLLGTVYNLVYVILINLVLQAIISGLIIDTFSSMREENENVLADIADKCFICSIKRDDFEQAAINFETHIKEEHNMWHYVWFKLYLELKDPVSYSSSENHAFKCMQDKQLFLHLMPIKKSFTLEKKIGTVSEERLSEKLEALRLSLEHVEAGQIASGTAVKGVLRNQMAIENQLSALMMAGENDDDEEEDDEDGLEKK